jgi:cytochrome c biogenesis protein CcdA
MGVGALDVARAETVQPYQQAALEAAPKSGEPVLIFVEASRFSTCAKERSIFQQLYPTPEFTHLGIFDATSIPESHFCSSLGVQMRRLSLTSAAGEFVVGVLLGLVWSPCVGAYAWGRLGAGGSAEGSG